MSDRESLAYLYGLQRFGIKLGLDNIRRLLSRAGEPQRSMNLVHVAGTNGKGSVCSILAALLTKAGHRTGLYTSPHLHDFNERIRVDDKLITDREMAELTAVLKELCEEDIPATFFEFTTSMALCYFQRQGVDWGVLETGMGGRLDATSVVEPEVVVITSVSMDHADHLGENIGLIAAEKAGIFKQDTPIVSAGQPVEVLDVLAAEAEKRNAPFYVLGRDFTLEKSSRGVCFKGLALRYQGLHLPLFGDHQLENMALSLAALELCGVADEMTLETVNAGLVGVSWPGRLEWWPGEQRILLDGAHNVAGCMALVHYLEQVGVKDVRLLFGAKDDKAASAMLEALLPRVKELILTKPPVEEAFPLKVLASQARADGVPVKMFEEVAAALDEGLSGIGDDVLLVAGSLFLVAAAREYLGVNL